MDYIKTLGPSELYNEIILQMDKKDIDNQHDLGSDLYVKVNDISKKIIKQYQFKNNVTTFIDNIDHELWYEIPFANIAYWNGVLNGGDF